MPQARAAPGSASERMPTRVFGSRGPPNTAHFKKATGKLKGNHIRANMVDASLVAGPLIIHAGRLLGERATPNPRGRWTEKALHPTHPRWGRLPNAEPHRHGPWNNNSTR